jgi:prevent-host-death family protein
MPIKVNVHEAKTNFSKILTRVLSGEEVIVAKAGKSIARLVQYFEPGNNRKPGSAKNKIWVSDNFNDPLPKDILKAFFK